MTLDELLRIRFDRIDSSELDDNLKLTIEKKKILTLVKINAEFVVSSLNDNSINKLINSFDLKLIDGASLLWIDRLLKTSKSKTRLSKYFSTWLSALVIPFNKDLKKYFSLENKYSGIDLTIRLFEFANKNNLNIGIFIINTFIGAS